MQNASKHGLELEGNSKEGVLILYEVKDGIALCCGNYVSKLDYRSLSSRLSLISSLSNEELVAQRNASMLEIALSDQGNGGLGLIEMAIATENQFEYSFDLMTNNQYFFSIEIKLKNDRN